MPIAEPSFAATKCLDGNFLSIAKQRFFNKESGTPEKKVKSFFCNSTKNSFVLITLLCPRNEIQNFLNTH